MSEHLARHQQLLTKGSLKPGGGTSANRSMLNSQCKRTRKSLPFGVASLAAVFSIYQPGYVPENKTCWREIFSNGHFLPPHILPILCPNDDVCLRPRGHTALQINIAPLPYPRGSCSFAKTQVNFGLVKNKKEKRVAENFLRQQRTVSLTS